jgi:hypothetical protein
MALHIHSLCYSGKVCLNRREIKTAFLRRIKLKCILKLNLVSVIDISFIWAVLRVRKFFYNDCSTIVYKTNV